MKVTQGGWWGMRIPSDGIPEKCQKVAACTFYTAGLFWLVFLVYAEKYIWHAGGWETPAEQISTLHDWLSLPSPSSHQKEKNKKGERKKIQASALYV